MRKTMGTALCVGLLFTAAACGGSGSDQEDIADQLIDSAREADVDLDEDCAREVAAQFSDTDAQKMIDNFDDTEMPDLSPEGQGLLIELFSCADVSGFDLSTGDTGTLPDVGTLDIGTIDSDMMDSIIDQAVANLPEGVDEDCFRSALEDADPAQLASGQASELVTALTGCMSGG